MKKFLAALLLVLAPVALAQNNGSKAIRSKTTTSASVGTSSVQLVGSNFERRGFTVWNNSSNSAYLCFAATCSSAAPVTIIPTFTSFVMFSDVAWTGELSAIRNAGTGTMTVTEIW